MIVALEKLPLADKEHLFKELWQSLLMDYQAGKQRQLLQGADLDKMANEFNALQHTTDAQTHFLAWRADYEKMCADLDDGFDDKMHDEIWQDVRDKNDFGREVSFD